MKQGLQQVRRRNSLLVEVVVACVPSSVQQPEPSVGTLELGSLPLVGATTPQRSLRGQKD